MHARLRWHGPCSEHMPSINTCLNMCMDMWLDMCIDMRVDMHIDMHVDMRIDTPAYGETLLGTGAVCLHEQHTLSWNRAKAIT